MMSKKEVVLLTKHTVRIEETDDEIRIFVNSGVRNEEKKPLAYITGSNCLMLRKHA